MNEIQSAAFELRVGDLKEMSGKDADLAGTLLAACSTHQANAKSQVAVIRYLLSCGVPIDERDKNGVTPLHRAVRFRKVAAVKELAARGANINARDMRSNATPLHRAVVTSGAPSTKGRMDDAIKIAAVLLSHGADRSAKNKNGKTPMDYLKSAAMRAVFRKNEPQRFINPGLAHSRRDRRDGNNGQSLTNPSTCLARK